MRRLAAVQRSWVRIPQMPCQSIDTNARSWLEFSIRVFRKKRNSWLSKAVFGLEIRWLWLNIFSLIKSVSGAIFTFRRRLEKFPINDCACVSFEGSSSLWMVRGSSQFSRRLADTDWKCEFMTQISHGSLFWFQQNNIGRGELENRTKWLGSNSVSWL